MSLLTRFLSLFGHEPQADLPIRFLGDMQRLQAQPGDVLVLSTDLVLTEVQRGRLRALIAERVSGHQVLVLEGGLRMGLIAPAASRATEWRPAYPVPPAQAPNAS